MSTKAQAPSGSEHTGQSENTGPIKNPGFDVLSLSRAVRARKAEYTGRRTIRVKVGTWNVAGISGTEKDVGKWFVQGDGVCPKFSGTNYAREPEFQSSTKDDQQRSDGNEKGTFHYSPEEIDLYVLGLQEVVDISSPTEALRPYVDLAPSKRWKEAVGSALPEGYQLVSEVQLVGLLLLIYASPAIGDSISSVSSTYVGTGLMGYMGNKGAVTTRLVLGETTRVVFVNCHLAAGSDKSSLDRRNWDSSQIVQRARFDAVWSEGESTSDSGEAIGDEDFTFWFGDLNYRLDDIPGDDVRLVLARHTDNEYDKKRQAKQSSSRSLNTKSDSDDEPSSSSPPEEEEETEPVTDPVTDDEIDPHNDPTSLQTTISSLLPHDQLRIQQRKGAAFHKGWREGHITFLPTYKYDVGSVAVFDSSEKQRAPSWCDRILFRSHRDKLRHEKLDQEAEEARKRDEEMKASGLDKAVADDYVLFEYDPDADGVNSEENRSDDDQAAGDDDDAITVASIDSSHDSICLDHYVSHQGILSSDHKPLDAVFALSFDAVNRELKLKVHQEVARELDKAENEARPDLTVVVDKHGDQKRLDKDPDTVDFGDIAFDVPAHRSLTIANTSGTAATFSFSGRHDADDKTIAQPPSWLVIHVCKSADIAHETGQAMTTSSESHTLLPGEVANVDITAYVRSIEHVRLLNIGKVKLEDIIVLHVDGGRDHFISVHGHWLPTCFGCSVDELTRMPEAGARSLAKSNTPHPSSTAGSKEIRLSAPRELFRLTEAISELTERAVAEWSMTNGESEEHRAPWATDLSGGAWPFQPDTWTLKDPQERAALQTTVREALDTSKSLTSIFAPELSSLHRLEVLSETLLTFLNALQDGIVTAKVWQDMEQQIIAREKSKSPPRNWEETQAWVLEHLAYSPAHSVSFTFVTFMLAHIANEVAPISSGTPLLPLSKEGKHIVPTEPADKQSGTADQDQAQSPTPTSATALVTSGSFHRRNRSTSTSAGTSPDSTGQNPSIARRQAVETALASIFSLVLISVSAPLSPKEKERRISEERRRSIIEPFLKMVTVDDRGPSGGRS
ncbi:Phosphatase family protein [Penicillium digitatum]|uniref:Phosphatase family protein n=3 Tax=Penicillium digitatum TaxID=36651 RepID=K9GMR6_PEND2|nr:Phosphatase family protein [Penicillium digitatum Pd1]EKV12408.1 Phosphatase family protein [Penicillium digitatum Pd1]EKV14411.1 Phosphatase family protein [Penicillium digitatum PHI26]QQK43201.1 Phosphatase family protein [Penicillium digitatum]